MPRHHLLAVRQAEHLGLLALVSRFNGFDDPTFSDEFGRCAVDRLTGASRSKTGVFDYEPRDPSHDHRLFGRHDLQNDFVEGSGGDESGVPGVIWHEDAGAWGRLWLKQRCSTA